MNCHLFLGKWKLFGMESIPFMGPLSFQLGIFTLLNSWYGSDPIPFCNTRKDPKSAWSTNLSLTSPKLRIILSFTVIFRSDICLSWPASCHAKWHKGDYNDWNHFNGDEDKISLRPGIWTQLINWNVHLLAGLHCTPWTFQSFSTFHFMSYIIIWFFVCPRVFMNWNVHLLVEVVRIALYILFFSKHMR